MDRWDLLLVVFAAYMAITTFIRLMTARRNELVEQVRVQVEQHQKQEALKTEQDEEKKEAA